MKREVIDFYANNQTPVEKLITIGIGRKGLTLASITAAAESLYDEIQAGLEIKPVRISWEVFSRAKILKGSVEKVEFDKTVELENKHGDLQERFDALQRERDVLQEEYDDLSKDAEGMMAQLDATEKELEIKNMDIARYLKELEWYHQPWWRTIFRRPPNG